MKKVLLFVILAAGINVFAHFPVIIESDKVKGVISNVDFAPLQIGVGFFKNAQLYDGKVNTFFSLGALGVMQESAVISFSPITTIKKNYFLQCSLLVNGTEKNYFLTLALFNITFNNNALQLGIGNISTGGAGIQTGLVNADLGSNGQVQIGAYNIEGIFQLGILNANGKIQFGLLNYNRRSYIPWLPFINWDMGKSPY